MKVKHRWLHLAPARRLGMMEEERRFELTARLLARNARLSFGRSTRVWFGPARADWPFVWVVAIVSRGFEGMPPSRRRRTARECLRFVFPAYDRARIIQVEALTEREFRDFLRRRIGRGVARLARTKSGPAARVRGKEARGRREKGA